MKVKNNYTSYEQSKRLVELGLLQETADAWYKEVYRHTLCDDGWHISHSEIPDYVSLVLFQDSNCTLDTWNYVPCWGLGQLLEILPKTVKNRHFNNDTNILLIYPNIEDKWLVGYGTSIAVGTLATHSFIKSSINENLVDSVYEIICWLLENGYLTTEMQNELKAKQEAELQEIFKQNEKE